MSSQFVYNAFGDYDVNPKTGEKGTMLSFGGVDFFFPYQQVRVIPDWSFRDVDHAASTPQKGEVGRLVYTTNRLQGQNLVAQLLDLQIPVKNREMGLLPITGKATGNVVEVPAGYDEDGNPLTASVQEKEPTKAEVAEAERLAKQYKTERVQEYYQSKRQRMTGGQGRLFPDTRIRAYMDELGLEDIDDVKQKDTGGLSPDVIKALAEVIMKAGEVKAVDLHAAVESVRKAGGAQLAKGKPKSLGLAENKARYDAEQAEKVSNVAAE